MKINKTVFNFLLLALLFHFVVVVFDLAEISKSLIPWVWAAGGIAIANLMTKPALKFLTVKRSFVTEFIATVIITTLALFALDLLVPGIDVKGGKFGPIDLEILTIKSFKVDPTSAKILFGAIYGILVAGLNSLNTAKSSTE